MVFDTFSDKLFDAVCDSELCDEFRAECNTHNNELLFKETIRRIKLSLGELCAECLVSTYHELRTEGFLHGNTRNSRLEFFKSHYLIDDGFVQSFLQKYPVINDAATRFAYDHIHLCLEIIRNFYVDLDDLTSNFGPQIAVIESITLPVGDLHNGKGVCIVSCRSQKIVYKPRGMECDQLLELFMRKITAQIPGAPSLFFPKAVGRDDHTWQEYIETVPCKNMEEVHRFYYRAGLFLAAFYLFSSCDMHYDNMICFGEHPVFFDVETLVTGKVAYGSTLLKNTNNSVLATNVLPTSVDSPVLDVNMSALFTGKHVSKKAVQYVIEADDELDWVFSKRHITVEGRNNKVLYLNREVSANEVEKDIIEGFVAALCVVIQEKESFQQLICSVNPTTKIRQVIRPTQVYAHFISACRNPVYSSDLKKADEVLSLLMQNFTPGNHGYLRVEQEVADLRCGYIPSFYSVFDSLDLFSSTTNQKLCKDYFVLSPRETVLKKIRDLDHDLISYQQRLISMSLLTTCDVNELHGKTVYTSNVCHLDEPRIVSMLKEYTDYILKSIYFFDEGKCTMALPIVKEKGFAIHSIDFGLYDSGGMIWYLACYGYYFDPAIQKYVSGLVNALYEKYELSRKTNPDSLNYSLSNGLYGFLYLVFNIAKLYGERRMHSYCLRLLQDIIEHLNSVSSSKDLIDYFGGVSGGIYLLCKLFLDDPNIVEKRTIDSLGEKFLSIADEYNPSDLEFGFAHGRSGLCVAFAGLYDVTKRTCYLDALRRFLPSEPYYGIDTGWCRGVAGWQLSCELINRHTNGNIQVPHLNNIALGKSSQNSCLCLCHGFWGELDVLMTVYGKKSLINGVLKEIGFSSILDLRFIESSMYCYESFMAGGSGIAYTLLRQIREVPSLLSLDIFDTGSES